jgi:DNA-binding response OmpR family regulator
LNLLIVEDEPELSKSIAAYLVQDRFACEIAPDYISAIDKVMENDYDCIVLDLTLPDGNGLDLLQALKKAGKPEGVLIISAKNAINDRIRGLDVGADDYLIKPFHMAELSARINSIIRRRSFNGSNTLVVGSLTIRIDEKAVLTDAGTIALTRKEFELLLYFAGNKNRVITKEAIISHLWGTYSGMSESYDIIYSHIKNLRKKLADAGCPDYIKAVYGMGYKFAIA